MNPVTANLPGPDLFDEQQIELLERIRHTRQKSAFLPPRRWAKVAICVGRTVVNLQKKGTEKAIQLSEGEAWLTSAPSRVMILAGAAYQCAQRNGTIFWSRDIFLTWGMAECGTLSGPELRSFVSSAEKVT